MFKSPEQAVTYFHNLAFYNRHLFEHVVAVSVAIDNLKIIFGA